MYFCMISLLTIAHLLYNIMKPTLKCRLDVLQKSNSSLWRQVNVHGDMDKCRLRDLPDFK